LGEGALLVQPEMAEAFEMIVKKGRAGFYQGPLAESMINAVKAAGGYLSADDLAAHRTEVVVPITLQIGSLTVHQTPPPSQGEVMLEALNLLSRLPIDAHWRDDSRLVHQVVQALRWSFYDRRTYLGDPALVDFDARTLLTEKWRESRQSALLEHRDIPTTLSEGDTTSFVAVDRDGNAVSFIHSLALQFGSGVFVPQGGFFLNNRSGRSFNTIPGHPNQAQPGKRPMHTLNTYMVTKDDVLELVGNTPGGDGQPQWNTTILLDLIYGERLPHQAVGLPRFTMAPATDVHNLSQPYLLQMESRFSPQVIQDLEEQGHRVQVIGPYAGGGSAQVIRQRDHGLVGASDPRGIGQTLGY
ncbi:MAG: gamma-glutamyltransferase family protein, partial [Sulfobacillus sp.]